MKQIVFLAEAEEEMFQAARYYESQTDDLGIDFLAVVQKASDKIIENPEEIVVIAVIHLRRHPGYWRDRL